MSEHIGDNTQPKKSGNDKKSTLADSTALTPPIEAMPETGNGPVTQGNGTLGDNVTPLQPTAKTGKSRISKEEHAALDDEELANDALLDDDEGATPGDADEITQALIVKKLPPFSIFRASLVTFDLWGTVDKQGMDDLVYVTTRTFAPNFEEDVELRRIRFFETVTTDGVVRLVWAPVPEKRRQSGDYLSSKLDALEHAQTKWTTMRTRMKLTQYTHRPSAKQEEVYGEPKFSGRTPQQWVAELKKQGILIVDKDHEFYRKATDSE